MSLSKSSRIQITELIANLLGIGICSGYVIKKGISNLTGVGVVILVLAGVFLLITSMLNIDSPYLTISTMFICFLGTGFIMTTATVGVVSPFPKMVGTAMACFIFRIFSLL